MDIKAHIHSYETDVLEHMQTYANYHFGAPFQEWVITGYSGGLESILLTADRLYNMAIDPNDMTVAERLLLYDKVSGIKMDYQGGQRVQKMYQLWADIVDEYLKLYRQWMHKGAEANIPWQDESYFEFFFQLYCGDSIGFQDDFALLRDAEINYDHTLLAAPRDGNGSGGLFVKISEARVAARSAVADVIFIR